MAATDRRTAQLFEYLIHEAHQYYEPDAIEAQVIAQNDRIGISFNLKHDTKIVDPPTPPRKVIPTQWDEFRQETKLDRDGTKMHWTWPKGRGHLADWTIGYTKELLRFCPTMVTFRFTDQTTGNADPHQHNAVPRMSQRIDDHNTVIMVIEQEAPSLNWYGDQFRGTPTRPNVIYPNGISRSSLHFSLATSKQTEIGYLEDGQVRAPATSLYTEFRIVSTHKNRRHLQHPDLPGINDQTIAQAIEAASEINNRWETERTKSGMILNNGPIQAGQPYVTADVSHQPYGEPGPTVIRYPVCIDQAHFDIDTRAGLANALMAGTQYTAIDCLEVPIIVVIDRISGTTYDDEPKEIQFDTSYGNPIDDDNAQHHRMVRPMKSMTAYGRLKQHQQPDQSFDFPVPALMCNNRLSQISQQPILYITAQARDTMTAAEIKRLIHNSYHREQDAQNIANMAINGRTYTFEDELKQLLKKWKPNSGYPDHPVIAIFERQGFTIKQQSI